MTSLFSSPRQSKCFISRSTKLNPQSPSNQEDHHSGNVWYRSVANQDHEEHVIDIDSQLSLQKQIEIYSWRAKQHHHLVGTHHFYVANNEAGRRQLRVIIEKTKPISSWHHDLAFREGINLLIDCLKGFKLLFQKFGPFRVSQGMISIDRRKNGKVWANGNFQKNYCVRDPGSNQSTMIQQILSILYPKIETHPILEKIKNSIENVHAFTETISLVESVVSQSRYSRFLTAASSNSQRKYFQKTPENPQKSQQKRIQDQRPNKQLCASSRQPSYKFLSSKPACLEFKQKTGAKNRGKANVDLNRYKFNIVSKQNSELGSPGLANRMGSEREAPQGQNIMFKSKVSRDQRNQFTGFKNSDNKFNQKSRQRASPKQSCQSRDLSFKSHKLSKTRLVCPHALKPSNILQPLNRKRKTSTYNHSPPSQTYTNVNNEYFKGSPQFHPITKSMTVIKKQLQILRSLRYKDFTKQSTRDLEFDSSRTLGQQTLLLSARRHTTALQLQNARLVQESFIQDSFMEESKVNIISQLNHLVFNRLDDLKQSVIIMEDNEQQSLINSTTTVEEGNTEGQSTSHEKQYLRKMSNKPMAQSITIEGNDPAKQSGEGFGYSALDRLARVQTQSRVKKSEGEEKQTNRSIKEWVEQQY